MTNALYAPGRPERNGWLFGLTMPQTFFSLGVVMVLVLMFGAGLTRPALILLLPAGGDDRAGGGADPGPLRGALARRSGPPRPRGLHRLVVVSVLGRRRAAGRPRRARPARRPVAPGAARRAVHARARPGLRAPRHRRRPLGRDRAPLGARDRAGLGDGVPGPGPRAGRDAARAGRLRAHRPGQPAGALGARRRAGLQPLARTPRTATAPRRWPARSPRSCAASPARTRCARKRS